MFTGIIEELGRISRLDNYAEGSRITIAAELITSDIKNGDSIAVNGVCLTALDVSAASFAADVSPETLDRTTLGRLRSGSAVNLEPPCSRLPASAVTSCRDTLTAEELLSRPRQKAISGQSGSVFHLRWQNISSKKVRSPSKASA